MTPFGASRRELEKGKLIRLLPDWDVGTVELNAVYLAKAGVQGDRLSPAAEPPSHRREPLSIT